MEYLFDTNAVISFVCNTGSFFEFKKIDRLYLSCISKIELFSGFKNKDEEKQIKVS